MFHLSHCFHSTLISRRHEYIENLYRQWRVELEEIIEVAILDGELWVSMLSEAMKTFPSTGSLNTDISDLEEHRPIFGELVNDLRKLLKKQNDPAMLPLECHYLNKTALTSVAGQQPTPVKHFTLKRKPKSAALRAELLQKSTDAASNLKKSTAPTVPIRSRGMPRKMTDTSKRKSIRFVNATAIHQRFDSFIPRNESKSKDVNPLHSGPFSRSAPATRDASQRFRRVSYE